MALVLPHREGQYRAELFEELVRRILAAKYPNAKISQDSLTLALPSLKPRQVDFVVLTSEGATIFVESRAPYSTSPWAGIGRTARWLEYVASENDGQAILALATTIPPEGKPELESVRAKPIASFEVWDEPVILKLAKQHLGHRLASLSTTEMLTIIGEPEAVIPRLRSFTRGPTVRNVGTRPALPEGRHKGAIILMADFCSFSKFVHASRGDDELVSSIMGRLYREARKLVGDSGGVLDKFMGDGLLAYWLPDNANGSAVAARFLECAKSLTGMAMKLADEWQEQVDLAVETTGMRCGAAIGDLFVIAEEPHGGGSVHAIGEEINLAARLQTAADANSLVISNRLRTDYFRSSDELVKMNLEAKNIGMVVAWKKAFA